ncbi:Xaa-Pro dipeptidyl-peptidase [Lentibacillus sp.]|uniref:Xaa-Pro dipeptidyl-peptidase n=1 Tax=Lentibacillus sp. TaxID=1925746 RepID=UPI002B4B22AA|nr:Xaa-Pro dipeptidyl-peptidase [Lentibacillus sp.]HLS07941.1 Xaa-Pro dipeptidyl-peptidase [Lentibacillus sp.]
MKHDTFKTLTMVLILFLTTAFTAASETSASSNNAYQLENGVTEPIYSYEDAIRETIYVESSLDSDNDGEPDRIAADIIRPQETEGDLQVPVVMDASPYYERLGRGNESEIKDPDGDGINEKFPLFYDNYFVPRGYAVVLVEMVGTNNSDGCPTTGGYEEIESAKTVIEWLNGNGTAWNEDGKEIEADWTTGKTGMIGKSYDGTIANGVAATGVEGLETIVPIGAISSWYDYYRYGGIPFYPNGPSGLSRTVTSSDSIEECAFVREEIRAEADDETGDYNDFWDERNFVKDADQVNASVFVIHGLNDYNVKANHFSNWWEELANHDVPRKLWLTQTGHVDPFDFRRAEWVDTLHKWFDHWLLDIDNGIMDEPTVDIERSADEWETYSSWPLEDSESVKVKLGPATEKLPGTMTTTAVKGNFSQTFTDNPDQTEQEMVEDELTAKENRLMFLSPELKEDMTLSGVPEFDIRATVNKEDTNLTALIVDYGADERVNHRDRGEGVRTLDTESCWGASIDVDDACYKETEKTTHTAPYEIVTHGWLDAQNWRSLSRTDILTPGKSYRFQWDTLPEDYVFKKGHRIGIVIAGSDDRWLMTDDTRATFNVELGQSHVKLPIVGGKKAFERAIGGLPYLQNLVDELKDDGEFNDEGAIRRVETHLTTLTHYQNTGSMDKAIKHLNGFKPLLEHQKDQDLMSEVAYNQLMSASEALLEDWQ